MIVFDEHRIAVAADANKLCDGPRREGSIQRAVHLFSPTTARCPFGYDAVELESPCFLGRRHNSVPLRGPIVGLK
jgi:hypothetical protein